MSSDSNPNVNPPEQRDAHLSLRAWILRMAFAIFLGVGISILIGVAAWSAPYGEGEIRSTETDRERQIRELRDQEVTQLRIALGRRLAANRRADLYFRLAEIYLEWYRAEFLLEGRVHDKRLADGRDDPFIERGHSKPYLRKGIQACQEVIRLGIPFSRMDRIVYFLGFNYGELGDSGKSLAEFRKLVEHYPSSEFVGEAYRELGDDSFDRKRYREAQGYFELAIRKGGPSTNFPRVLHRLAWSYYRTREYGRAVETMKKAVTQATNWRRRPLDRSFRRASPRPSWRHRLSVTRSGTQRWSQVRAARWGFLVCSARRAASAWVSERSSKS